MSAAHGDVKLEGPRPARPEDLEAILETINYVHRVLRNRPPRIAEEWPHIYNAQNAENIFIVRDGGRVASTVGIWVNEVEMGPARLKVGGINCLATLPDYRCHGLGTDVMAAAHERMRELGCQVGLLGTMIVNWYRKLGWEHAGCSRQYRFDRGNIGLLPSLPGEVRVRPAGEEAMDEVIRLRRAERLGGVREAATFRTVLASRGQSRFVLAERGGRALAYLLARERSVAEWGGPAELVAGLVRAWFDLSDDKAASTSERDASYRAVLRDDMTVGAPGAGHPLPGLLERLRIPFSAGYLGMVRLLDAGAILRAYGVGDVEAAEKEGSLELRRAGERCVLPLTQAAKLFFGPERVTDFGADVFPLPFWQWPLEHV